MKRLWIGIVAGTLSAGALVAGEQGIDANSVVEQIRQAGEARAIELYRKVMEEDKGDVAARGAFVQRMVELGSLGRAYDAARTLIFLDADNGTAWGVIAYRNALYGQMREALEAVLRSAQRLEGDAFVVPLAGQLLAWYDTTDKKPTLGTAAERRLELMRPILERSKAFVAAYDEVRAAKLEGVVGPGGIRAERQETVNGLATAGRPAAGAAGGLSRQDQAPGDEGFAAAKFRPLAAEHFAGLKALARDARPTAAPRPAAADRPRDADHAETPEELGIALQPFSGDDPPARGYAKDSPRATEDTGYQPPRKLPSIEPYPFSGYLDPAYYAPCWPAYYATGWPGHGWRVGHRPMVRWLPMGGTTLSLGGAAAWGGGHFRVGLGLQNVPIQGR